MTGTPWRRPSVARPGWARRCRERYDGPGVLFGIVQGGLFPELREASAHDITALDFPGYAIGGVSVGEPRETIAPTVRETAARLPEDRPRYLMGVGLPGDLVRAVARGVDLFDCVLPTRNARNGTLFTSAGRINIKRAEYQRDPRPLDEALWMRGLRAIQSRLSAPPVHLRRDPGRASAHDPQPDLLSGLDAGDPPGHRGKTVRRSRGGAPCLTAGPGPLVFVGDVHLEEGDAAVPEFVSFLEKISDDCSRLILLGDLFNVWIGRRELEEPHQTTVLRQLSRMRRQGVVVRYIEGNRDYRIHQCYAGDAIDDGSTRGIVEEFGGLTISVTHGDLVNPSDRQYRLWRAISRSAPLWALFSLLSQRRKLRIVRSFEARLRGTNLAFKQSFPEAEVRRYAERILSRGHDAVVLGHFHVEKDLQCAAPGGAGRLLVLPEWKGSRRHLRVETDGEMRFVDSPY